MTGCLYSAYGPLLLCLFFFPEEDFSVWEAAGVTEAEATEAVKATVVPQQYGFSRRQ